MNTKPADVSMFRALVDEWHRESLYTSGSNHEVYREFAYQLEDAITKFRLKEFQAKLDEFQAEIENCQKTLR